MSRFVYHKDECITLINYFMNIEKDTKIAQVEALMKKLNLSADDLIEYWHQKRRHVSPPRKPLSERISILYIDGTVSKQLMDYKPVWGIAFGGYGIYLNEMREQTWLSSLTSSSVVHLQKKTCTNGDRYFWSKMGELKPDEVKELSEMFVRLGGKPLTGIYWTDVTSGHGQDQAWAYCIDPDQCCISRGLSYGNPKRCLRKTRPIVRL